MKNNNFTSIYERYKGKWVALSDENKVIVSGDNAKDVFNRAKQAGYEIPYLFKVPTEMISYVG
jgi:hypothetical protein